MVAHGIIEEVATLAMISTYIRPSLPVVASTFAQPPSP